MKALKLEKKSLLKYLATIVLFYLCAIAKLDEDLFGFAISLYVALVYCRCNIAILSPIYVIACILADHSLGGIIYAISPVVVMSIAKFVHFKLAKTMKLFACNLYALISFLPMVFVDMYSVSPLKLVMSVVITQVATYLAIEICYAIVVRGTSHKMSADELVGGIVTSAIISLGLYKLNFWGFMPYFLFLGFLIMYTVFTMPTFGALLACFGFALGGCLGVNSLELGGAIVAICLIALTFSKTNKWICAVSIVLADLLCGVYFNSFASYGYLHIVAVALGALSFALIPKKLFAKLPIFKQTSGSVGAKNMLNRSKKDISARLEMLSNVFFEMATAYQTYNSSVPPVEKATAPIAHELMIATCADCKERENCTKALGRQTNYLLENVVNSGLATGKAMLVDLPNFINSRCIKIPSLLANCNSLIAGYYNRLDSEGTYRDNQQMMSSQLAGVGAVLQCIGEDVNMQVGIDNEMEEKIVQELGYNNIVCTEVNVFINKKTYQVSLVVRDEDKSKKNLGVIVGQLLGIKLTLVDTKTLLGDNRSNVTFVTAPKFDIVYAYLQATKEGEKASGDVINITRLRSNKVLVGLCDGMGSGVSAQRGSSGTLDMISNFYKSGFDNTRALSLVNKLLAMTNRDNFSALDMCVVDLENACVDFIKLGGVQSFIRRADVVEIVETSALPIGIVEEATPEVKRMLLSLGDMVVLISDGISDALTVEGVQFIIDKIGSLNPQVVCDEIMGQAKLVGLGDDSSVIAFRIFEA